MTLRHVTQRRMVPELARARVWFLIVCALSYLGELGEAHATQWALGESVSRTDDASTPRQQAKPIVQSSSSGRPSVLPAEPTVSAHSTTYLTLFRREAAPGSGGAIAHPNTELPAYEYLLLRVFDINTPWKRNALDGELSLWGGSNMIGPTGERAFLGDISVACINYRADSASLKLGRQYVTYGAARFSHLDGVSALYQTKLGFSFAAYGGLTVLPRWNKRPNYTLLGTASDTLFTDPDALPRASRSGNWMAGARAAYAHKRFGEVGLSFHEQQENALLGRRDVAIDLHLPNSSYFDGNARMLVDLDSLGLADAFIGLAVHPTRPLDIAIDYRRILPTLLMSRQSVLSVFSVDRFDELGGELRYQVARSLQASAGGFIEWFERDGNGLRARLGLRWSPDSAHRILVNGAYSRVFETLNGYHSSRLSFGYRITRQAHTTIEQYLYRYDRAIAGKYTSSVHAATIAYRPIVPLELALAGSLVTSPYAALDAQTLLRASYAYGPLLGGEP